MTPQDTAQYGQVLRVSVVRAIFKSRNSARASDNSKKASPTPTAAVPLRNVRRCICIANLQGAWRRGGTVKLRCRSVKVFRRHAALRQAPTAAAMARAAATKAWAAAQ